MSKEELVKLLKDEDLPQIERDYIVSVIEYIDELMAVSNGEQARIGNQINKMFELCKRIEQRKTGIPQIDNIKNIRKQKAFEEIGGIANVGTYETPPYVNKYIQTLSQNGGLMEYVTRIYSPTLREPYDKEPEPLEPVKNPKSNIDIKSDLLIDLKTQDISEAEAHMIAFFSDKIDSQMSIKKPHNLDERLRLMADICEQLIQDPAGRYYLLSPRSSAFIATISQNGGIFSYVKDTIMEREERETKKTRKTKTPGFQQDF